jgi:hypothetical protein
MITKIILNVSLALACNDMLLQSELPPPPSEPEELPSDAIAVSDGFLLRGVALSSVMTDAEKGDKQATFRLSMHFLASGDRERYLAWLEKAAMLEHPVAQYNMWFEKSKSDDCNAMRIAVYWLEKSAANGFDTAKGLLDEYRKKVSECH